MAILNNFDSFDIRKFYVYDLCSCWPINIYMYNTTSIHYVFRRFDIQHKHPLLKKNKFSYIKKDKKIVLFYVNSSLVYNMTLCLITKTTLFLKIWSRPAKQMKSHSELPWRWLFLRKIKLSPKTKNFFSNVHAIGTTLPAWWMLDYCGVNPIINISGLSILYEFELLHQNSNIQLKLVNSLCTEYRAPAPAPDQLYLPCIQLHCIFIER